KRILAIPVATEYKIEAIDGSEGKYTGAWIKVNGLRLFGVLHSDVDSAKGESFQDYKTHLVANLQDWLHVRTEQRRWPVILNGLLVLAGSTLALAVVIWTLLWFSRRLLEGLHQKEVDESHTIMVGGLNIRPQLIGLAAGLYKMFGWAVGLSLVYLWLTAALHIFPYTEERGRHLTEFLFGLLGDFGRAILFAMPDLLKVALILFITRLVSRLAGALFSSAESGALKATWLEPETARATRRIITVLIWTFGLVLAYPFIPGSQTTAFKGVSVFVGLMVSLGSAGMVGQVVGGILVVYTRAFKTGDYIKVGDNEGVVREIGVLSTKITTRMKEEVTIPNAVLLAATTINYTRHARDGKGVLISTKVTIGYDAPWRQVHSMLLQAASLTAGVRKSPGPRVLQGALSDFYPEYTLLVSIDRPEDRYVILSELHGNIQDVFNENGVQIMSPNFEMQPEQPVIVPKEKWFEPARKVEI
ncbi:MAG: mechanosensitive ion channel family protein, partial [Deltaproteobacteria bacterium]